MREVVGKRWVLDRPLDRSLYAYDAGTVEAAPELIVLPATGAEVQRVLRIAHRHRVPVIARGAGTCLSGGPVPVEGGIVLALNRMCRILSLDVDRRIALVEPGVINAALQAAAGRHGLGFMPDPSSLTISTLGGNAAENAGGPRAVKHGVFRRHQLGLEWVMADGTVITSGELARAASAPSSRSGPQALNLAALLIGSEGTLGVITRLALALEPLPAASSTLLALFSSAAEAARAIAGLAGAGLSPSAAEIMGRLDIQLANEHLGLGLPANARALLVIEFDGPGPALSRLVARAAEVARAAGALSAETATDPSARARLWAARRASTGLYGRVRPASISGDITVPRSRVAELFAAVADLEREAGLPVGMVGHAGDGNLHPAVLFDPADPGETAAAHALDRAIVARALELGGSITGEHGVGVEKLAFMQQAFVPEVLRSFEAIKTAFDPAGILNPGKAIPAIGKELTSGAPLPAPSPSLSPVPSAGRELQAPEWPLRDPATLARYNLAGPAHVASGLIVPDTREQLIAAVRAQAGSGTTVIPVGSGTHVRLAFRPFEGGIAVSTAKLDRVMSIDPDDLSCTVEAGCTHQALATALQKLAAEGGPNLRYAVDAWRQPGSTLGGEVAMDLPGTGWRGRGATREQVLGLTWINAAGKACPVGARTVKDVAGYDLTRLLCGSWGTLGIIADVTLRLETAPECEAVLITDAGRDLATATSHALAVRRTVEATVIEVVAASGGRGNGDAHEISAETVEWRVVIGLAGAREDVAHWRGVVTDLGAAGGLHTQLLHGSVAGEAVEAAQRAHEQAWARDLLEDQGRRREGTSARAETAGERAGAFLAARVKSQLDPNWLFAPMAWVLPDAS
jgi:glycolate oxidase subunit GlcD